MRVVILGSGRGSNAEAILLAQSAGRLGAAHVVQILSDQAAAGILALGPRFGVPAAFVDPAPFKTKLEGEGEARFIAAIRAAQADLVVLAGFMRVLKPGFLEAFAGKIINLHPSLLPSFPGLDGIGQAFRSKVKITGCTVHQVALEVDGGPILDQATVRLEPADTLETLAAKVHAAEHELLPAVIARAEPANPELIMAVYELKAEVVPGAIEFLEELLAELEDQRLMLLEDKPAGLAWVTGYFETGDEAAAAWQRLTGMPGADWRKGDPEVRELPDADWRNSYKAHFKASKFGRLNWVPVWERETFGLPASEEVLWLDPGMAFGTGNHETTRLCCERLAAYAAGRGQSGRVLDAGCGSGILALSAVKLGFQHVAGFDNDPEAIRVSEENAGLNGLAGRVDFFVADLGSGLTGRQAELVMANIQSDVLMRYAEALCSSVAPAGELVLSGILSRELAEVRGIFTEKAKGWKIESRVLGEWADLRLSC